MLHYCRGHEKHMQNNDS
uniref:Uncharacterized protein n=1 Tax=Arundo donax TaxID=35708 RepID=A0A0A9A9M7_ARUDO